VIAQKFFGYIIAAGWIFLLAVTFLATKVIFVFRKQGSLFKNFHVSSALLICFCYSLNNFSKL